MKKILLLFSLLSITLNAQVKTTGLSKDYYDKIIGFSIENKEDKFIELTDLYNSITSKIPNDEEDKLIVVEKLKKLGFKKINWGRGNHSLGPRIISITLKKGNCECEVIKIYYSTSNELEFRMTEKIKCKKNK